MNLTREEVRQILKKALIIRLGAAIHKSAKLEKLRQKLIDHAPPENAEAIQREFSEGVTSIEFWEGGAFDEFLDNIAGLTGAV